MVKNSSDVLWVVLVSIGDMKEEDERRVKAILCSNNTSIYLQTFKGTKKMRERSMRKNEDICSSLKGRIGLHLKKKLCCVCGHCVQGDKEGGVLV